MTDKKKRVADLSAEELAQRREKERLRKSKQRSAKIKEEMVARFIRTPREKPFIAIDGEGMDIEGKHTYVMLMSSTGEMIANPAGLSSQECFDFLKQLASLYTDAIFCVYGASYDINMWLRDVPREKLKVLHGYTESKDGKNVRHDASAIRWNGYKLQYRPRKELWVGVEGSPKYVRNEKSGKYEANYSLTFSLWDVIGFFQTSFVEACGSYLGRDYPTLAKIKEGKDRRRDFTPQELESYVIPYTRLEVGTLVLLMNKLRENLLAADLHLTRWDGGGACAMALLKREHVKDHLTPCPRPVNEAACYGYAGGHIELGYYGYYDGDVFHYDIKSAYPDAMRYLHSLTHGRWRHFMGKDRLKIDQHPFMSIYKLSWDFDDGKMFYPFPYRLTNGTIRFPRQGANWVWRPELQAAIRAGKYLGGTISIQEAWCFYPDEEIYPFAFLPDLFDLRARWKREGNGAEKGMKLGINSLYGKMVQHVGYHSEKGKLPPYHQLEYGGCITSFTRGKLFDVMMQAPEMIIAVATDGIFSRIPLDVDIGENLGQWEYSQHHDMVSVQSGVYFVSNKDGSKDYAYYRGFDKGSLTREMVLAGWKQGKLSIPVPSTRFVTLGSALASDSQWENWRSWRTIERDLHLNAIGTKRKDIGKGIFGTAGAHKHLVKTLPEDNHFYGISQHFSEKYALPWENEYALMEPIDQGVPRMTVDAETEEAQL